MSRMPLIDPATATGKAAEQLTSTQRALGATPNFARAMANSPSALQGYLGLSTALREGVLPAGMRERIALAMAELNGCHYCLSAHTQLAPRLAKLTTEEIEAARRGTSSDPKAAAVLRLAVEIAGNRGRVGDDALADARAAGLTDEEIVEVIANVVQNLFTNYLNEVLDVEVDFPLVTPYGHAEV
ncbi:carboxymuconolactone decarboxylase family protein [Streptomyces tuirus]|uniref:Carboxymuconolactone decarboxylase family protein n=1 Tax=Streptomyces tuirus TaxID=68278 RepID=A0A941FBK5_9ACTN|nr:carboxymuconolactone decarboxylase family protein [Streptomyces tuirus]MBR8640554.1 carboxymuconolactone decarboxylase family protein [Streptomyces tuirus]